MNYPTSSLRLRLAFFNWFLTAKNTITVDTDHTLDDTGGLHIDPEDLDAYERFVESLKCKSKHTIDEESILRAFKEIQVHQYGRALRALTSNGTVPLSQETIEALKALYPQGDYVQPVCPPPTKVPDIELETVSRVLKKEPKTKGTGIDGWRAADFLSMMKRSDIKDRKYDLLAGLTAMCNDVAKGCIHTQDNNVWQLLATAKGTALKKDKDPLNTSVRPIGVLPFITALTIKCIVSSPKFKKQLPKRLVQGQLGMGSKGGVEALPNIIRAYRNINPKHVIMSMDIKNAFNSISRQAIFDTSHINPELGPLQHLLYAKPNQVIYPGYVNVQDNSGRSVKKPIKYVPMGYTRHHAGQP